MARRAGFRPWDKGDARSSRPLDKSGGDVGAGVPQKFLFGPKTRGGGPPGPSPRSATGLLEKPLSIYQPGWKEIRKALPSPYETQNKDLGAASQALLAGVWLRL